MSITRTRFNEIRARLIVLYNILNNRLYGIHLTPAMMMSIDEIRDREYYRQEDFANDEGYYEDYQVRHLTIPSILEILPNVHDVSSLGWADSNNAIVEIYETIQENIALWCEIRNSAPEFVTPSTDELRTLEMLARQLFPRYKKIRPYLDQEKYRLLDQDIKKGERYGLLTLASLFGIPSISSPDMESLSFVSHLDDLEAPSYGSGILNGGVPSTPGMFSAPVVTDSIAAPEVTLDDPNEWLFKGSRS